MDELDRTSLRPLTEVPRAPDSQPPSSSFDGEDFLFHLYRGSELLQDDCVAEAKEELEHALRLQPRDVSGQGLLGVVYFRLGMYPRAIQIYERLIAEHPREVTPRVNAALCFLKTGQPVRARELLEEVIERVPDHRRAWGYLGLVLERQGELEKARNAFEHAGQPTMVARLAAALNERHAALEAADQLLGSIPGPPALPSLGPPSARSVVPPLPALTSPLAVGADSLSPVSARPPRPSTPPSRASAPPPSRASSPPPSREREPVPPPVQEGLRALLEALAVPRAGGRLRGMRDFASAEPLVVPVAAGLIVAESAVRALVPDGAALVVNAVPRRSRGRVAEEGSLPPTQSVLLRLDGAGVVVLAPPAGQLLLSVELDGELPLYLREERLLALSPSLSREHGRLARGAAPPLPMVQLSGRGTVHFAVGPALTVAEIRGGAAAPPVLAAASAVVGWVGRLLPGVDPDRAALLPFSGDGALLLEP